MAAKVIDVSYWQKDIDWDAVVASGVTGVIIKISEGTSPEETWWGHVSNAESHGLSWGVYCYSHATDPVQAVDEANEVVYLLGGRIPKLGVWFDFEDPQSLQASNPIAICSAFISFCNGHGLQAGIYASLSTFTDILDINQLADYVPYWVAQYNSTCDWYNYFPNKRLLGWQYSDQEYIGNTNVDMNEWYGEV